MRGWIGIAAFVAAYDAYAVIAEKRTLSAEFRDTSRQHPTLLVAGTVYMVAHLFGAVPKPVDPLCAYTRLFASDIIRGRLRGC